MHRITKFDLDSSYIEYVDKRCIDIMKEKVERYNSIREIIERDDITETMKELFKKEIDELWLQIIYTNPCGMKLTARMTTNYRQLKTIYAQRRNHRLPEWRVVCAWIETLPNQEFITGRESTND